MKKLPVRTLLSVLILLLIAVTVLLMPGLLTRRSDPVLPRAEERRLLRVWVTSSTGGGMPWLTSQLRAWEKQHPGVMTYLRTVAPADVLENAAVLPDVILYTPGDFTTPETIFLPLSGELSPREELLRCGRWQTAQYGLPLCWSAWTLAIDSAYEPGTAATPIPTTLLGRPLVTPGPEASAAPDFPLEAVRNAAVALQAPTGGSLFTLAQLLEAQERPSLPENFASLSPAEVYSNFRSRTCAAAMLTTGQVTAMNALTSAGKGFAFRTMVAEDIVTDQIWLASIVRPANPEKGLQAEAASLLAWLTATEAQRALSDQELHTVRDDLRLYATGTPAQVEAAAARGLSAINAYMSRDDVAAAAWQAFQGGESFANALLPLL